MAPVNDTSANSTEYQARASAHSKSNIMGWLAAGLGYNALTGHLISFCSLLLVFPGIYAISLASMLTYVVDRMKRSLPESVGDTAIQAAFSSRSWAVAFAVFRTRYSRSR